MSKVNLPLSVLISFISVGLYAADGLIEGLETAGKIIQAAEPVIEVIKEGAEAVGKGIANVAHKKTKDRVTALEEMLPNCVQKKDFDASQKAQEEEIGRLRAKIPTAKHPHNFVQNDPNDAVVTESRLKTVTAPLQSDVNDLKANIDSRVTQQQLTDAMAGTVKEDPNNPVARENRLQSYVQNQLNGVQGSEKVVRQNQMQDYVQDQLHGVVRDDQKNAIVRQHDLNGYITKDEMRDWVKNRAGQFALGFSSYRLSWMIESLLKSAGMKNEYVDLKDISVPLTTFLTSFIARSSKEMYQTQGISDAQMIAHKSLLDTASSAIVIALKNIIFDEQMRAYWDERLSENQKAGAYAVAVVPVSVIVDLLAHQ